MKITLTLQEVNSQEEGERRISTNGFFVKLNNIFLKPKCSEIYGRQYR